MTTRDLQHSVQSALECEPSVDATQIGVTADNGVVTLRGDVMTYREKQVAERVALAVYGVRAVANDLQIRSVSELTRTDSDLAQAALAALRVNSLVPQDRVTVTVTEGRIVLRGSVDWQYQKENAARAVGDLVGVKSVTNSIAISPSAKAVEVRLRPAPSRASRRTRVE